MHLSLVLLETLWLLYYVSLNIATYAITDISIVERAVRQDVFNLGTHISIVLAAIFCKDSSPSWLFVLYAFELFRDVMNGINLQHFSPLQAYNHDLWIASLVLVWYQVATTVVGFAVCFYSKEKTDTSVRIPIKLKTFV